jgi:hypothetical protein
MVALNHAIAAAMVHGATMGLELLDGLKADTRLAEHHRLDAVRAHSAGTRLETTKVRLVRIGATAEPIRFIGAPTAAPPSPTRRGNDPGDHLPYVAAAGQIFLFSHLWIRPKTLEVTEILNA